jgi:hypothetical protein
VILRSSIVSLIYAVAEALGYAVGSPPDRMAERKRSRLRLIVLGYRNNAPLTPPRRGILTEMILVYSTKISSWEEIQRWVFCPRMGYRINR